MTSKWIVGLDGSSDASAALRWAVHIARSRRERVAPICAWHLPLTISVLAGRRAVDVDRMGLRSEAEFVANEAILALRDDGDVVDEPIVVEGHPGPVLLDCAGRDRVVVVGRRGVSALQHRILGSVSQHLATHSSGPVVVVPDTWTSTECNKIVVGFDGSEHARAALRWALAIAPEAADVTALIGVDVIPWLKPELVEERYPDEVRAAQKRMLAAADQADPTRRAERRIVLHGPHQALGDAARDADLIVVGPRGVGAVARVFLGSITTWLLHSAPCPVAVVPS